MTPNDNFRECFERVTRLFLHVSGVGGLAARGQVCGREYGRHFRLVHGNDNSSFFEGKPFAWIPDLRIRRHLR